MERARMAFKAGDPNGKCGDHPQATKSPVIVPGDLWQRVLKALDLGGRLRLIPVDRGPGIPDDAVAVAFTPLSPTVGDGWETFPQACRALDDELRESRDCQIETAMCSGEDRPVCSACRGTGVTP